MQNKETPTQKHFNEVMRPQFQESRAWYSERLTEIGQYFPAEEVSTALSEAVTQYLQEQSYPQAIKDLLIDHIKRSKGVITGNIAATNTVRTLQAASGEIVTLQPEKIEKVLVRVITSYLLTGHQIPELVTASSPAAFETVAYKLLDQVVDALHEQIKERKAQYLLKQEQEALAARTRKVPTFYQIISMALITGMVSYGVGYATRSMDTSGERREQQIEAFLRSPEARAHLLSLKQSQPGSQNIVAISERGYSQGINIQRLIDEPYVRDGVWYQQVSVQVSWLDAEGDRQTAVEFLEVAVQENVTQTTE